MGERAIRSARAGSVRDRATLARFPAVAAREDRADHALPLHLARDAVVGRAGVGRLDERHRSPPSPPDRPAACPSRRTRPSSSATPGRCTSSASAPCFDALLGEGHEAVDPLLARDAADRRHAGRPSTAPSPRRPPSRDTQLTAAGTPAPSTRKGFRRRGCRSGTGPGSGPRPATPTPARRPAPPSTLPCFGSATYAANSGAYRSDDEREHRQPCASPRVRRSSWRRPPSR